MKKFIVAGLAAVTLAGGAFAFAANLTVTSQNLGAGTVSVTNPCTQIDTQYKTSYDNATHNFWVTEIDLNKTTTGPTTVHGCTTQFYKVSVDDGASGQTYSGQLGQSPNAAGTDAITIASGVLNAHDVVGVTAVVTNQQQS